MSTAICTACGTRVDVVYSAARPELRWLAPHKAPPALNGARRTSDGKCHYGGIQEGSEEQ